MSNIPASLPRFKGIRKDGSVKVEYGEKIMAASVKLYKLARDTGLCDSFGKSVIQIERKYIVIKDASLRHSTEQPDTQAMQPDSQAMLDAPLQGTARFELPASPETPPSTRPAAPRRSKMTDAAEMARILRDKPPCRPQPKAAEAKTRDVAQSLVIDVDTEDCKSASERDLPGTPSEARCSRSSSAAGTPPAAQQQPAAPSAHHRRVASPAHREWLSAKRHRPPVPAWEDGAPIASSAGATTAPMHVMAGNSPASEATLAVDTQERDTASDTVDPAAMPSEDAPMSVALNDPYVDGLGAEASQSPASIFSEDDSILAEASDTQDVFDIDYDSQMLSDDLVMEGLVRFGGWST